MTILIDNNIIQVRNSAGQIKFTSNDKLVYLKAQQIGTINFNGGTLNAQYPFANSQSSGFTYISIKFNSCNGNALAAELIGKWIPANGTIVTNIRAYGAGAGGQAGVETSLIGLAAGGTNSIMLTQYGSRFSNPNPGAGSGSSLTLSSGISGSFTYDARIYSYL